MDKIGSSPVLGTQQSLIKLSCQALYLSSSFDKEFARISSKLTLQPLYASSQIQKSPVKPFLLQEKVAIKAERRESFHPIF